MNRFARPILATLLVGALAAAAAACSNRPPDDNKDYAGRLEADRAAKDALFKNGSDPIPENRKGELLPLAYFPIEPDYHVAASLKLSDDDTVIPIPTSTGTTRRMRRAGTLEFSLKGQVLTLTALVEVGAPDLNHLFVPFTDLTSGTETYPAGRYIDLERNGTGVYELDFNRAYHPYCYYNAAFECPYPPPENRLRLPIHAGERIKKGEK